MARPRKTVHLHSSADSGRGGSNSSSSGNSDTEDRRSISKGSLWKTMVGMVCLLVAVYYGSVGYLETRVNTPFNNKKVVEESGLQVPERYWGSYRPGNYFGLKTRDPKSAVFGLMWYSPSRLGWNGENIRHWCSEGDHLQGYGWTHHDGLTFGEQHIADAPYRLNTSYVKTPGGKYGGQWTARITVDPIQPQMEAGPVSVIWYAALDEALGPDDASRLWRDGDSFSGTTPGLGDFKLRFVPRGRVDHVSYAATRAPGLNVLRESLAESLRLDKRGGRQRVVLVEDPPSNEPGNENWKPNLVAVQFTAEVPFSLDVEFRSGAAGEPGAAADGYDALLRERKDKFNHKFEELFGLTKKGFSKEDVDAAKVALSNMVGSVGYFYGAGRVKSPYTSEPVPYWRAPLLSGVPSRSFFPRGFLWDEGFHGLLISRWSPELMLDITAHWFDLMNVEGWIPREQILGAEALARVPAEFVTQSNSNGNPPILLLQLAAMVRREPALFAPGRPARATLERMYTRLQGWYNWFNTTQRGVEPTSYVWKGRDAHSTRELNPKALSSGLDDYPRASHPTDDERHVDLRCWMHAAADALATIARAGGEDPSRYEHWRDVLGDEQLLNELHWSPHSQSYADYGLHTDSVQLQQPRAPAGASAAQRAQHARDAELVRVTLTEPQRGFVSSALGYVSLFPMLLKVLSPESPQLGAMLAQLDNPNLMWSPYGLRSLSKSSPIYQARNTQHDPPYWRGAVWLNINYLAVASLHHYAGLPGPHSQRAAQLYSALRSNLINNVLREYKRTGYFWEQYNDADGSGQRSHPFNGWTSLTLLMMAEQY